MTNPAAELLEIFRSWDGTSSPNVDRHFDQAGGVEAAEKHVRAMKLIWDIHRQLDEWSSRGQSVDAYREATVAWVRTVLANPRNWTTNGETAYVMQRARMDMLEGLSHAMSLAAPTVLPEHRSAVRQSLAEIVSLLGQDDSISDQLRLYILRLVQEIQLASDEFEVTGRFDAEEAMERLWVALLAASGQSKKHRATWKKRAEAIVVPAVAGMLASVPGITAQAVLQISAGS